MNIKYISLLSLLCIASAQCTEKIAKKELDTAKEKLVNCQGSWRYGITTSCSNELKAFEQAKQEFLKPHREKMNEGIKANNEFKKKIAKAFWNRATLEVSRDANYFETWGHGWIVEGFDGRDHKHDFLYSDKSAEEFSNQVLDKRFCTGESSYVEDLLGNGIMLQAEIQDKHQDHIDSARSDIKKMIKQQQ